MIIWRFAFARTNPIPDWSGAVRRALKAAGVEFIDENGGGAGVRLRKPVREKASKIAADGKKLALIPVSGILAT